MLRKLSSIILIVILAMNFNSIAFAYSEGDSDLSVIFSAAVERNSGTDVLGAPTNEIHSWWGTDKPDLYGTIWAQDFWGGTSGHSVIVMRDNWTTAYWVHGGIWEKWEGMGAVGSELGCPTSDEYDWSGGRRQDFENGHWIFWSSTTGAFVDNPGLGDPWLGHHPGITVPFDTVLAPSGSDWEKDGVGDPFILKEGTTYKMWYKGDHLWPYDGSIGYAESRDGINWTNRQQVHSNGTEPYDYFFTCAPWVIKENGTYRMWHADYFTYVGGDWSYYISHMTSSDGIGWGNEQTVLTGRGDFSYDDYSGGSPSPSVIKEANGTYSMWYAANQRLSLYVGGPSNIIRATSADGLNWPYENRQLVLPRISGGGEESVADPDIVREADGSYTMYYTGYTSNWLGTIYRAKSPDGITWTNREKILEASQLSGDLSGLTCPHYFKDSDGTEYLYFSCSKQDPNGIGGYKAYISRVRLKDIPDSLSSIAGQVKDGHGNYLAGVKVELLDTDYKVQVAKTYTNEHGAYNFSKVKSGSSCILRLSLENIDKEAKSVFKFKIINADNTQHDAIADMILHSEELKPSQVLTKDFDLSKTWSFTMPTGADSKWMDNAGAIWYNLYRSYEVVKKFGVEFDYKLPIDVVIAEQKDSCWYAPSNSSIHIGRTYLENGKGNDAKTWDFANNKNREWHEFGHAILADVYPEKADGNSFVMNLKQTGNYSHWGYANATTADSLDEGFAEFWTLVTAKELGIKDPSSYDSWGDLDNNFKAWDPLATSFFGGTWDWFKSQRGLPINYPMEEFAVAGLLWDLIDEVNMQQTKYDNDLVGPGSPSGPYSIASFIGFLKEVMSSNNPPITVTDLYKPLKDKYGDGIGLLFTEHGFFRDNNKPFWEYSDGEEIGQAANGDSFYMYVPTVKDSNGQVIISEGWIYNGSRDTRRSRPYEPQHFINATAIDVFGNPVDEATATVSITFPGPYSVYNFSYDVPLDAYDGKIYLSLPPSPDRSTEGQKYIPTATITVVGPNGDTSKDKVVLNQQAFGLLLENATENGFLEKAFTVVSKTGEEPAGGDANPPITTIIAKPGSPDGQNGWYKTAPIIAISANETATIYYKWDDGEILAALNKAQITAPEGIHQLTTYAVDLADNKEVEHSRMFYVDTIQPLITIGSPINGKEYLLNQLIFASWLTEDLFSGIAFDIGTLRSGDIVNTLSVGQKTFTVDALDNAGNKATQTNTYYVRYVYSGILQPINTDGSSIFKLGSTAPVRFLLKDANGNYINNAVTKIYVSKLSDGIAGTEVEAVSTNSPATGNIFRNLNNQYIFNLSTKSLSAGTWQIRILLDDDTSKYAILSLK